MKLTKTLCRRQIRCNFGGIDDLCKLRILL